MGLRWIPVAAIAIFLAPAVSAGNEQGALQHVSETKPAPDKNWYVLGGSFKTQDEAKSRVSDLAAGQWHVMKAEDCPRFSQGSWVAAAGPFTSAQAAGFAIMTSNLGTKVSVNRCH